MADSKIIKKIDDNSNYSGCDLWNKKVFETVLTDDIIASDQHLRMSQKGDSDWLPAIINTGNAPAITISDTTFLSSILVKGITVFAVGTITAGVSKVAIVDSDTPENVLWEANIVAGLNVFNFGDEGLKVAKLTTDPKEDYGNFKVLVTIGANAANSVTLHGWKP